MKKYLIVLFVFISFFSLGCSGAKKVSLGQSTDKPAWFWKPSVGEQIGGVGISKAHVRGISAQRELAVSRAIESIASQLGVHVENVTTISSRATSAGGSSTQMDSYSIHTVDGKHVKATVKEFWQDPYTNELYVWMVAE